MNLITSNDQLSELLPNVAVSVEGESPLIDKLTPFLNSAEKWVADTAKELDDLAGGITRDHCQGLIR